jgi:endonuclease/exonuclease/phosphatase family metal-dependent hydrolase
MSAAEPITVVSFNILTTRAWGRQWRWVARRGAVLEAIRQREADLIGLQEVRRPQLHFLRRELGPCDAVSTGRGGSERLGEHVPLLYDRSRFELRQAGHFWLGPRPNVPGSRWWWSFPPRVASWAQLIDRQADGRELLAVNTHLCCFWRKARLGAAKLIRQKLGELSTGGAAIVTGDFNAPVGGQVHRRLTAPQEGMAPLREALVEVDAGEGVGRRIDWILCSDHFDVIEADVDRELRGGRMPSDHWPIFARLRWR